MKKIKHIMGTEIEIIINSDNFPEIKILKDIKSAFNIFYDYQNEFSRFDENSSLSKINKNKSGKISDRFLEVLELSKNIYKKTNGYFNPLVNISNLGYDKSFEKIKDHPLTPSLVRKGGEENIDFENIIPLLNKEGLGVVSLKPNQNLDFGGIVKGLSVDKAKEFLVSKSYNNFIINAGGDIFSSSKSCIAIDSPKNNGDIFALLDIENIALCTSGTYKRKWKINGENFHHILNPKKSINNNEIRSISLITKKTYIGDAYATACIAMGIEKSLEFLKKERVDGVIIGENDEIYKVGNLEKYNFEII